MDSIEEPRSRLAKEIFCKLPGTMLILPYYDNALEWAQLLKKLRKGSRTLFKENIGKWKVVLRPVMNEEEHKTGQAVKDWINEWKHHFATHSFNLDFRHLAEVEGQFTTLLEKLEQNKEKHEVNICQTNDAGLQKYYFLNKIWLQIDSWGKYDKLNVLPLVENFLETIENISRAWGLTSPTYTRMEDRNGKEFYLWFPDPKLAVQEGVVRFTYKGKPSILINKFVDELVGYLKHINIDHFGSLRCICATVNHCGGLCNNPDTHN